MNKDFNGFSPPCSSNGIIPQKIFLTLAPFAKCQQCFKPLEKSAVFIRYKRGATIELKGSRCFGCNVFYLENSVEKDWLISALTKSTSANKYVAFNDSFCTAECLRQKRAFDENKKNSFFLVLRSTSCGGLLAVIITTEKYRIHEKNVYNYMDEKARKILGWVTRQNSCDETFELDGENYSLLYYLERASDRKEIVTNDFKKENTSLRMASLEIKKGGGFKSQDENEEVIAALVYSMLTQNYEVMYATYNRITNSYYVDIHIFRSYIQQYGKPEVHFSGMPRRHSSYVESEFSFNAESFLHMYGYNVNQKDNLTDSQRSSILAEIIDLGYMSSYQIVSFLCGLVSMRSISTYPISIEKWNTDIAFVKTYKVNPSRFVIFDKAEDGFVGLRR